jgi:carboxypeptidase Q
MRKTALKHSCLVLAFLTTAITVSQARDKNGAEANNTEAIAKLKSEGETHSKVMDIAFHLSDVNGPRLTASPGFLKAANWAKQELASYGLQNARLESWGEFGRGWEQQKCYVAISAPYYNPVIAIPKAWTGSTPGKNAINENVVLIDAADTSAFIANFKGKLAGKIVMLKTSDELKPSFTADATRYSDAELEKMASASLSPDARSQRGGGDSARAKRMQAYLQARKMNDLIVAESPALILSNSRGSDGTIFVQGYSGSPYLIGNKELPANVVISSDEYLRIQRLILAGVPVKMEADVKNIFYDNDYNGYNVIAEIPGTDPALKDEVVMIGAHLDSWHGSTGATDNAAGCAVMMEAVRLLKAAGVAPRRTIRIALWGGEEQGTHGSKGWVKNHLADPADMKLLAEHEKLSAYYNLDNGTGRIRGIYCQGNLGVMPIFQEWLNQFKDSTAKTVTISNTGSTDHASFDAVGIPGFQFIQDAIEYDTRTHHTNMDSYDHLVADDLKQAAALVSVFVYNTAQRDEKLPRKELPKPSEARNR